jgi:hypothetical protein
LLAAQALAQRAKGRSNHPPLKKGRCEKMDSVPFTSFRRKPESSVFGALQTDWTPVFTGVTAEIQFFHSFRGTEGDFHGLWVTPTAMGN